MIGLLALALSAWAAPTGAELGAWSSTGVEVLPDAYGATGVRAVERLGADIEFGDGWNIDIDGGLRILREPSAPVEGDLDRLSATHTGDLHRLAMGRIVRMDVRGLQRIDGASIDFDTPGIVGASLWGGRLWHPETWQSDAMVAGAQIHLNTGSGTATRTRVDGGYEARVIEGLYRQRIHLASTTIIGAKGTRMLAFAEIEPAAEGLQSRASFQAAVPLGRTVDLGLDGRWEDMSPDHAGTVRTPIDWLAPEGYSLASARVRWFSGPWDVVAMGGGTLRVGSVLEVGGIGRAGATYSTGDARAGVFGVAAAMAGTWLAGGGGEVAWSPRWLDARVDFGAYRFQGLDGVGTPVWEGRIDARVPVYRSDHEGLRSELAIGFDGAAGTDRQLATWVRGGVALHATVERRRR